MPLLKTKQSEQIKKKLASLEAMWISATNKWAIGKVTSKQAIGKYNNKQKVF